MFAWLTEGLVHVASAIILARQEKENLALRLTTELFDNLNLHFSKFCRVLAANAWFCVTLVVATKAWVELWLLVRQKAAPSCAFVQDHLVGGRANLRKELRAKAVFVQGGLFAACCGKLFARLGSLCLALIYLPPFVHGT